MDGNRLDEMAEWIDTSLPSPTSEAVLTEEAVARIV
jgi:hypothetical protein